MRLTLGAIALPVAVALVVIATLRARQGKRPKVSGVYDRLSSRHAKLALSGLTSALSEHQRRCGTEAGGPTPGAASASDRGERHG